MTVADLIENQSTDVACRLYTAEAQVAGVAGAVVVSRENFRRMQAILRVCEQAVAASTALVDADASNEDALDFAFSIADERLTAVGLALAGDDLAALDSALEAP